MIGSYCCFGPNCCFGKQVQCIYLHVLSVLLHSWFGFRVFIAICRFAAGIQINPGQPGPLGHARHPMLTTIHHSDMRIACLRLHPRRQPPAGYPAGSGPCYEHPRPLLLAPRVAPRHQRAARRGRARSKESSAEPAAASCSASKVSKKESISDIFASALLRASIMSVRVANGSMDSV